MPAGRRVPRTLTLALLAGAGLALAAGPASAASSVDSSLSGTVTSYAKAVGTATASRPHGDLALELVPPGDGAAVPLDKSAAGAVGNADRLGGSADLACLTGSKATCVPGVNGTWTLRLTDTAPAADPVTATFTLKVAPAAPARPAVTSSGSSVRLTWPAGAEPDLTGYTVLDGDRTAAQVPVSSCVGGSCLRTLDYPAAPQGAHRYSLVAHRRTAPTGSATLPSPRSAAAEVTFASPKPTASASPKATAGPRATASRRTAAGSAPRAGGGPAAPPPALGTVPLPKLPAAPTGPAAALADAEPDGTYDPTLGYAPGSRTERIPGRAASSWAPAAVADAFDDGRLPRFSAASLLLVLAGLHLRRWLGPPAEGRRAAS